ncbi:MAG: FMN-binding negative transcriptional regulator [Bdellovibrio sp.]
MYRPSYSVNENIDLSFQLIQDFPLGLMISESSGLIETNYLPFLIFKEQDEIYLLTHLARANPHWKSLSSEVVISFLGPNSYVSPTIYVGKSNVPTWSYAAIEIRGSVKIISDGQELKEMLHRTVDAFETKNQTEWSYDLPEKMQKNLESALVGLKIKVTNLESKFKLSQNRNVEDYTAVLKHFSESSSHKDKEISEWMLKAPRQE